MKSEDFSDPQNRYIGKPGGAFLLHSLPFFLASALTRRAMPAKPMAPIAISMSVDGSAVVEEALALPASGLAAIAVALLGPAPRPKGEESYFCLPDPLPR